MLDSRVSAGSGWSGGSVYCVWGRWSSEFDHEVLCQCGSTLIIIKFDYARLQALHGQGGLGVSILCLGEMGLWVWSWSCFSVWQHVKLLSSFITVDSRPCRVSAGSGWPGGVSVLCVGEISLWAWLWSCMSVWQHTKLSGLIMLDSRVSAGSGWPWGQYTVSGGDGLVSLIMKLYVSVTARKIIKFDYARLLGQGGLGVSILWVWLWSFMSVWQHIKLLSNLIILDSRPCRVSAGSGWPGGQYTVSGGDGLVSLIMKLYVSVTARKIIIKFDYARRQGQCWVRVAWGSVHCVWGRRASEFDHEVLSVW